MPEDLIEDMNDVRNSSTASVFYNRIHHLKEQHDSKFKIFDPILAVVHCRCFDQGYIYPFFDHQSSACKFIWLVRLTIE